MHYYQHHIGDFIKDTSYLTNEEIGIYMKLIWMYYDTEEPLPDNFKLLLMKLNCRDKHDEVLNILNLFFVFDEENDVWRHTRCDKEIAEYRAFCSKQKANGLKGGRPKQTQEEPTDNPEVSQDEAKITLTTNHKPLTNNHIKTTFDVFWNLYPKKKAKADAFKAWRKVPLDEHSQELILKAVSAQATSNDWIKENGTFIPLAATWLNGKRWEDEIQSNAPTNHLRGFVNA